MSERLTGTEIVELISKKAKIVPGYGKYLAEALDSRIVSIKSLIRGGDKMSIEAIEEALKKGEWEPEYY
jgi:hypothetical protein